MKYNFNPGPSIISEYAKRETAGGILNLNNSELSVMEISHRSSDFSNILKDAINIFKDLLQVPEGYHVLFLHGGASMQFCMVPYNMLQTKAAYLETGSWSKKAIQEAKVFGQVDIIASSVNSNYNYIPHDFTIPEDADYLHVTTNNTIYGTQLKQDIDSSIPVCADASSDILSRPIDVSKYGILYGGAQKNIGPAGMGFAIIRDDILGKVTRKIPSFLNYQNHIDKNSLYNTPPSLAIFASLKNMIWLREQGGIENIYRKNLNNANMLYEELERNPLFKPTVPDIQDRSLMNVTFVMQDEYLEKESAFHDFLVSRGIVGMKGHRSVGGFRASIYNAMPLDGIKVLIELMKEFENKI